MFPNLVFIKKRIFSIGSRAVKNVCNIEYSVTREVQRKTLKEKSITQKFEHHNGVILCVRKRERFD